MELAAIKAFLEVHPGVKIVLCFFHFRKTLRDNLSKKKITVEANTIRRFNKLYRMVCSLAFVPPSHTINVADTVIVLYLNKHWGEMSLRKLSPGWITSLIPTLGR